MKSNVFLNGAELLKPAEYRCAPGLKIEMQRLVGKENNRCMKHELFFFSHFRMQGSCSNKTPGSNFWTQNKGPPAQFTSGSARILHVDTHTFVDNYL